MSSSIVSNQLSLEPKSQLRETGFERHVASAELLECSSVERKKQLGQFFTPDSISALACASAIQSADASIIDPMAGNGAMLWKALDRLKFLGLQAGSLASIEGIEVDPVAAKVCALPEKTYSPEENARVNVVCADAFLELSGLSNPARHNNAKRYQSIVGNPPYVRYQALAQMLKHSDSSLMGLAKKSLGSVSDSVLVGTVIRASLIAHLVDASIIDAGSRLLAAIELLHGSKGSAIDPETECWIKLVKNYSGLADLSLPSWLLTANLAAPGAYIAYVTSSSWRNREYSKLLRYFMHRMMQPICVIEQEGNSWFPDALVPTSLIVLRARSREDVSVPLLERRFDDQHVRFLRINRDCNIAQPKMFAKVAQSFNSSICTDDLSQNADTIIRGFLENNLSVENELYSSSRTSEKELVEKLFSEDRVSRQSKSIGISLHQLEGKPNNFITQCDSPTLLPQDMIACLELGLNCTPDLQTLTELGVAVNQGLRTGCNAAFYFSKSSFNKFSDWFPGADKGAIAKILADPSKYENETQGLFERLREHGAFAQYERVAEPLVLLETESELGRKLAVMPRSIVRPAVRYQKDVSAVWKVASENLTSFALVIQNAATDHDWHELRSYPQNWLDTWAIEKLPRFVSDYLSVAAETTVFRNGQAVLIPKLSAVCTNVRKPAAPRNDVKASQKAPARPSWWYNMPILPRHDAAVFMARINSETPVAILNDQTNPSIIDANFSTFSALADISNEAIFAILNSCWVSAMLECIATPMGGGALKVEAAHLRNLVIPRLTAQSLERLRYLGAQLALQTKETGFDTLQEIDRVLCEYVSPGNPDWSVQRLKKLSYTKIEDRRR